MCKKFIIDNNKILLNQKLDQNKKSESNNSGSIYIHVIIVLSILSLLLNLIFSFIKQKNDLKNNYNLYYISQSGAESFLFLLNNLLDKTLESDKDQSNNSYYYLELFNSNLEKYLKEKKFELEIKDMNHDYFIKIDIDDICDLDYKTKFFITDRFNNNIIRGESRYKLIGHKFILISHRIY